MSADGPDPRDFQVHAAGGVVWRPDPADDSRVQVLIVHRPRYDDWSMPKGKLDDGEAFDDAARREITEETGVIAELGADLGAVTYVDHKGRAKLVRWWAARAQAQTEATDVDEVDQQRWVTPEEAAEMLTYPLDVDVLARFRATVAR